jgi:hypothetical protein
MMVDYKMSADLIIQGAAETIRRIKFGATPVFYEMVRCNAR